MRSINKEGRSLEADGHNCFTTQFQRSQDNIPYLRSSICFFSLLFNQKKKYVLRGCLFCKLVFISCMFLPSPPPGTTTSLLADAAYVLAISCDGAFDTLVLITSWRGAGEALFMKRKKNRMWVRCRLWFVSDSPAMQMMLCLSTNLD